MYSETNSNSKLPGVSIGMPVYNDEKYISHALDSLLAQSFEDFELIISDNASTDRTGEICKAYAAKDSRIRYIRQSANVGPQANFMYLLSHATGEFFMWAASDDLWDSKFISTLFDALKRNEQATSAFCPFLYIDEDNKAIGHTQSFDYSGKSAFLRIAKFCYYYNDAFIYGLHRRELIKNIKIPIWWWINSKIPMNCAYPVLVFFLACGGYVQVGESPLWFNRIHLKGKPRHSADGSKTVLVSYLSFQLRKINLFYESVRYAHLGTRSVFITLSVATILLCRLVYDYLMQTKAIFSIQLRRLGIRSKTNTFNKNSLG
ncbi:MAG TPA: glycosyltransferase [Chitinivibrionales bacterium]|nr:glycosyltransferase [Chitinivibrionales bacterium]